MRLTEEVINDIIAKYNALGQVSKSFMTKYRAMQTAITTYEALKSAANQDTTISTTISFLNLSNPNGTVINNGISVAYTAAGNNADFGINAQGTSNGTEPAVLTVNGLYDSIKSLTFVWTTNLSGGTTATITIKDGTTTKTYTSNKIVSTSSKTTVSTETFSLDGLGLDLSKPLTITIKNNSTKIVRIKSITFNVE